jgi:hypothetical protein
MFMVRCGVAILGGRLFWSAPKKPARKRACGRIAGPTRGGFQNGDKAERERVTIENLVTQGCGEIL